MDQRSVVLDTNVFVGAAFNRGSASARIVDEVRAGRLSLVWNDRTRRETQRILGRIPPLSWNSVEALFTAENRHPGDTNPERFGFVADPDDREFAALAEAAGVVLVTSDGHLLGVRERAQITILTPKEYWARRQQESG